VYASAQSLAFLARTENPSFPNRKPAVALPELLDGNNLENIFQTDKRRIYENEKHAVPGPCRGDNGEHICGICCG
jgi:hypothetical protein